MTPSDAPRRAAPSMEASDEPEVGHAHLKASRTIMLRRKHRDRDE